MGGQVVCPGCRQSRPVEEKDVNRSVQCPRCGNYIDVDRADVEKPSFRGGSPEDCDSLPRNPSLLRLLWTDSIACFSCFLSVTACFCLVVVIREGLTDMTELLLIAVGTVILPVPIWRVYRLRSLFRDGILVTARITRVGVRGFPWCRIEYEYQREGRLFQGGVAILRFRVTRAHQAGREITALVHPHNPSRSTLPSIIG